MPAGLRTGSKAHGREVIGNILSQEYMFSGILGVGWKQRVMPLVAS